MRRISAVIAFCAIAIFGWLLSTAAAGSGSQGTQTVMTGLDNPRGLAFAGGDDDDDDDGGGTLYVAEAGEGGPGPCIATGDPARPTVCYGPTGAITRLRHGQQRQIVTGMPSNAPPSGNDASGPHDISLRGGKYVTIGLGASALQRPGFGPGGRDFGWVVRLTGRGWRPVADVAAWEFAHNPDNGPPDSNPYGLLQEPPGRILTDAGGNTLLRFSPNGSVALIVVLPSRTSGRPQTDSVPTSVVRGWDRALYVGELTGVPFAPGAARIYRVSGNTAQVWLEGFTTIIDMTFACDGTLYVLQHSSLAPFFGGPGEVVRVERDGARSTAFTGLQRPTSLVFGRNGELYISNRGNMANVGEVLRVDVGESCRHDDDDDDD